MKEKVLVIGLGKSGFASAALLAPEAEVWAWDAKPEKSFDPESLAALRALGVRCLFEDEPDPSGWDKAVLSPGVPLNHPLVLSLRANGCRLSGELEEAFLHCKGRFFAITGTNGKTTTTALCGEMVRAAGLPCEVVGNIGLPASSRAKEASEETVMVTEVSSFQLETTSSFRPAVSALLNVTPDHLNRHGSFEEYARVKGLIYANQTPDSYFIYNADDPVCRALAEKCPCIAVPFSSSEVLSFGAYVQGGNLVVSNGQGEETLLPCDALKIPGKHNLENALAASAVCYFGGIEPDAIRSALRSFAGVAHRIEPVATIDGVRYINDSKGTNPDSTIKALEAVEGPILLIAGGYEKNSDFTELIQHFPGRVRKLLLLGTTAQRFAERALALGFPKEDIVLCKNMEQCVERGRALARPGDCVLLSPASASWDMYSGFEERGDHFKRLVEELR